MAQQATRDDLEPEQRQSPWWEVLLAPWVFMHRPRRAAACMTRGRRFTWLIAFVLGTCCVAAVFVFLRLWAATVERRWLGTGPVVREFSLADVWHQWHRGSWIGTAELNASVVLLVLCLLAGFGAWLFLAVLHREGSVWRSYRRAFQAVASGVGLLAVLTLGAGSFLVVAVNAEKQGPFTGAFHVPATIFTIVGSACVLVVWLSRAAASLGGAACDPTIPPRCEGCGYDLTHRPDSGRCPECGLELVWSLTPELRRPGCSWEARGDVDDWIQTSFSVVVSPRRFYEQLKLRTPARPSAVFAQRHYAVIGLGAGLWSFLLILASGDFPALSLSPIVALMAPLVGWALHRTIGACVASAWVIHRTVPDMGWASKVMAYETSYLWVFWLFNGVWITSLFVSRSWCSGMLAATLGGQRLPWGMPPEVAAMIVGNIGLITAWAWRYHIAGRAIRWSNY